MDLSTDTGDYDGRVPMHLACANGHLEACKVVKQSFITYQPNIHILYQFNVLCEFLESDSSSILW